MKPKLIEITIHTDNIESFNECKKDIEEQLNKSNILYLPVFYKANIAYFANEAMPDNYNSWNEKLGTIYTDSEE